MTTVTFSPLWSNTRFVDANGKPLAGGQVHTYIAGSSTVPQVTYQNSAGTAASTNPIVLDSGGLMTQELWLSSGQLYNFVLTDSFGNVITSADNIFGVASIPIPSSIVRQSFVATAGQTLFNLSGQYQPGLNLLEVYVNGALQLVTTDYTETNSTSFTFVTGLNAGDAVTAISYTVYAGTVTVASLVGYGANNVQTALDGTVNFTQSGTGAVSRLTSSKLKDTVSVKDFGAVGDGTTDDTAAFNAAIAAVAALSGGGLVIVPTPTNVYKITSVITVPSNVTVRGQGTATIMITGSGFNAFNVTGSYAGVENLNFQSASQRSSGIAVAILGSTRDNFVRRCQFANQFYGITVGSAVITWIEDCEIMNTAPTTGIGIDIQSGNDTYVRGVVMDGSPSSQPLCGLRILNSQGVWVTDCDFIHQGIGVSISPSSLQATWLFFNNVACDTGSVDGWQISATGTGIVRGVFMTGCWSSTNDLRGLLIQQAAGASVDGVFMSNCHLLNNGRQGLLALAGPTGVYLSSSVIAGNSRLSSGTYAGADFQSNCTYFGVQNSRIGTTMGFANSQAYGVLVNLGTSDNYTISGNNLSGNITAGASDGGSGTNKFVSQNIGYATQSKGSANIAVGASTSVVTHGLPVTPSGGCINVVPTQKLSSSGIASWWISAIGSTTFTVNSDVNVTTAAFTFEWNARVSGA